MQKQYLENAEHLEKSLNAKLEGLFLVMTLQFFLATLKVGQPFEMKYLRAYIRIIKQLTLFKPGCARLPSGLTFRSSRPAFGGRLSFFVSLFTSRSSHPMLLQTAATCSSACALGCGRRGRLRLLALRGVQGFLSSSAYASGASSSVFCSAVSNSALKRTRILRAAYLVR